MTLPAHLVALHFAIRIALANRCPISDCDEVFNYWEPLHFLNHGVGFQTWEYAPTYALRTFIYIVPLALLERIYQVLSKILSVGLFPHLSSIMSSNQRPFMFQLLRGTIAFVTALCEVRLVSTIKKCYCKDVAYCTWFILLVSTGMFVVGPSFLPSATVMNCVMMSISDQLERNVHRAILWGLVACLATGWPFSAVLFVPLAMQSVFAKLRISCKDALKLILWVCAHASAIQFFVFVVDWFYYGKIISPTINIFVYNTGLGSNEVNRDDLYGIEEPSYYIKNLLLNWNMVAILGIIVWPLILFCKCLNMALEMQDKQLTMLIAMPMFLWFLTVFPRSHKEERFLYPIYPCIAVAASFSINYIAKLLCRSEKNKQKVTFMVLLSFAMISISRSLLLYKGYNAPMRLYNFLFQYVQKYPTKGDTDFATNPIFICTGLEWFRFQSSYNLPERMKLAFLPSDFSGQLPQYFSMYGSKEESLAVQGKFNDINAVERDRFVNISDCSFIIDLVGKDESKDRRESKSVLALMKSNENKWQAVTSFPFLNSFTTSMPHRLIYIPFFHRGKYKQYTLFEREM
jgi:alpha-1,2-mannosyltransferase